MTISSTKKTGDEGELIAIKYLQSHEYHIVATNYKFWRAWEIDVIAEKGWITIFIEVKYRRSDKFWTPEESITKSKLHKFKKTIYFYCLKKKIDIEAIRFDVITIVRQTRSHKLSHYRNVVI